MNTINEYGDDDWATPEKENIMELKEQIINDIESNPIVSVSYTHLRAHET